MNRKSVGWLAIGIAGAVVVSILIYWNSNSEVSIPIQSEDVTKQASAGLDQNIESSAREPETMQSTTAIVSATPATAMATADVSRPDAGYYENNPRPYGVSGFLFFFIMTNDNDQNTEASINKIREVTKVDEETARRFLAYVTQAKGLLKEYQLESHNKLCAQRAQIATTSQLAVALKSTDTAVENRRGQLVRGSESILGADGMRNFETYLSNKDRNQQSIVESNEERLARMNKPAAEVLALLCDPR